MKVLVTGATGFLGSAVCRRLDADSRYQPIAVVRGNAENLPSFMESVIVGDLGSAIDWSPRFEEVETVIHTAARTHVMDDSASHPLEEFRRVNVRGSIDLARQAIVAGVSRFIYISSIKVNGESTVPGIPFTADDLPRPEDPYAVSKWEAEEALFELSQASDMELVVIRPPLVYGRGIPMPLGAIENRRSLIGLSNLVDLIVTCIDHPAAANRIFLAADGEDLSTSELLRRTAAALGKPIKLLPVPIGLLKFSAALLGKGETANRLIESLQIDISGTRSLLGWEPLMSVDQGLRLAAEDFNRKVASSRTPGN